MDKCLARRRRGGFTLTKLLVIIAGIALLIGSLLPAASRVPRAFYQGQDQFYWMNQLHGDHSANHEQAITALSTML